jgi:crotonobetainyl-CoA:carnitine CoA-transferase CaiB-like acyl-CoA transferase
MPPSEARSGALAGIHVLDFGQYIAGPLAAMMLADQGAEVIRIAPPGGPRWKSATNAVLQRGKRSFVLDLKQPADQDAARRGADGRCHPKTVIKPAAKPASSLAARPRHKKNSWPLLRR